MRHILALCVSAFLVVALAGCAAQQPKMVETASGKPEAFFEGKTPDEVASLLAASCIQRGWMVDSSSGGNVKCSRPASGGQDFAVQMMYGAGAQATQYLNFFAIKAGDGTKAYAQSMVEVIKQFGGRQAVQLDTNEAFNSMMEWLYSVGGK